MGRQVVVMGGGAGGALAVERLRERLGDGDRVVVVDKAAERVPGLSLPWVMRGWRTADEVRVAPAVLHADGVDAVEAEVTELLPGERRAVTTAGELRWDALVIALGAAPVPERMPGLVEAIAARSAGELATLEGAATLHERLDGFERGRIVVLVSSMPYRCPASPYEAALLIDDMLAERGLRDAVEVDVITPEPLPMPVAGRAVGEALVGILQERRIGFHGQQAAERVDAAAREVVLAGGEREPFDLLVAIPPHVPPAALASAGLGEAGWVPVEPRTLRTAADATWALGDATVLKLANGLPLPKAAVFTIGQAEAVAADVARAFGHDAPAPWFTGEGHCYVELGGGRAAKGVGSFLEPAGPVVELYGASRESHAEKEQEEHDWIARWLGTAASLR